MNDDKRDDRRVDAALEGVPHGCDTLVGCHGGDPAVLVFDDEKEHPDSLVPGRVGRPSLVGLGAAGAHDAERLPRIGHAGVGQPVMQRRKWRPWAGDPLICARGCGAATASFLFGIRRGGTTSVAPRQGRDPNGASRGLVLLRRGRHSGALVAAQPTCWRPRPDRVAVADPPGRPRDLDLPAGP
jgi:hypothetical protein